MAHWTAGSATIRALRLAVQHLHFDGHAGRQVVRAGIGDLDFREKREATAIALRKREVRRESRVARDPSDDAFERTIEAVHVDARAPLRFHARTQWFWHVNPGERR